MYNPRRSLFWMVVYLALVAGVCAALYPSLEAAFLANWGFNTLILGVLLLGIGINLAQVLALEPEIRWISLFRTGQTGLSLTEEPRLLGGLARHLAGRIKDRFSLSALSLRTVLDGIRARLDEAREISRYMIGLLIFLGLLGTFWGLLGTVSAVGGVIAGLQVTAGDAATMFEQLKAGLAGPLAGMGTAFSSSLFGLGGSLVLGFLDILAGQAQNRFFNALEEWLSGLTQLIDEPSRAIAAQEELPLGEDDRFTVLLHEIRRTHELLEQSVRERGTPPAGD
ncbi:MAG TPA: flagellar motor protein MotA [Gammaproteobacteria bacterium]